MAASPQTRRDGDGESGGGIGTLLHRDALYEILLRVPAKPLCRFRAVCRSWRSLLSAPSSFVAAHAARHRCSPCATGCPAATAGTGGGGDGEYKVLSLSTSRHYGMRNLCKILTVDAGGGSHGEWRDVPAPPVVLETFHRHTLVASGTVYHLVDRSNGWTIAAFDLEAEQWLPDLLHGPSDAPVPLTPARRERRSLAEVNRRLAAVYSTASTMDLWLLMGSGDRAQFGASNAEFSRHPWTWSGTNGSGQIRSRCGCWTTGGSPSGCGVVTRQMEYSGCMTRGPKRAHVWHTASNLEQACTPGIYCGSRSNMLMEWRSCSASLLGNGCTLFVSYG
ncbi:hypothetical protein HU200_031609 [Digitaria exilis]|uniref:F-box domain-containing protein n=1 Tax=Digitaria exilis TaxID=1010633 RepID=A0A835EPQ4_9POAL|nr:hypothetical protein HU200_031609 [Digitaria exilis]